MNMYIPPCGECQKPERGPGCHGGCRDYKIWTILNEIRRRREKRLADARKAIVTDGYLKTKAKTLKRIQEGRK